MTSTILKLHQIYPNVVQNSIKMISGDHGIELKWLQASRKTRLIVRFFANSMISMLCSVSAMNNLLAARFIPNMKLWQQILFKVTTDMNIVNQNLNMLSFGRAFKKFKSTHQILYHQKHRLSLNSCTIHQS